uniref:DUF6531 domain-containing protein n=1 Tax=Escherichia coli TaxID=562 RepID=UPI001F4A8C6E
MSGKPAARQGDMTQYGGPIVQGSAPGETDLALPGPLPFILSRTYSSYRTRTPAPVGVFGPGWKAPSDIRL